MNPLPHSGTRARVLATSLLALAAALALPATTHASVGITVAWGTPQAITGDSDVVTTGSLLYAYSFGATGDAGATVNGVAFAPFVIPNDNGSGTTAVASGVTMTNPANRFASNTAFGSASAPFSALSSSYQSLLSAGTGMKDSGASSGLGLNLAGLTGGQTYTIEIWINDAGLGFNGAAVTDSAKSTAVGATAVAIVDNVSGANGSPGEWVTGTFTEPGGTTGIINFTSTAPTTGVPLINAFELRTTVAAPEPGSAALALLGGLGLLLHRRRNSAAG